MSAPSRGKLAKAFVQLLGDYPQAELIKVLAGAVIELKLNNQLDLLMKDINRELFKKHGHVEVDLVSASQLSQQILQQLHHYLRTRTQAQTIKFNAKIDENLLGGFVASTPGQRLDLSIRAKLKKLEARA